MGESPAMQLILYSGGSEKENRRLSRELRGLLSGRARPVITFVPASSDYAKEDFEDFRAGFPKNSGWKFRLQIVDGEAWTRAEEKALLASDAIFLGGGNTYHFLDSLRRRRLLPKLRAYARRGGILLGLSAGSILMTPNIMTAAVPAHEADDNDIGLTNLNALGLVPFEFSPHYYPSRAVDADLLRYSRKLSHPIYACADGQGIVVKDGSIHFIGQVAVFHRGSKFRLQ